MTTSMHAAQDRQLFNDIAEHYCGKDRTESSRVARRHRLRQTLELVPLDNARTVLEVGCGAGFSADYLEGLKEQGSSCNIRAAGKKGVGFMRFAGHEMTQAITELDDIPKFEDVDPFSTAIMDRFLKGEISSAQVAYMKFESAGKQTAVVEQLLPMTAKIAEDPQDDSQETALEYEFSPEPKDLLDELLPIRHAITTHKPHIVFNLLLHFHDAGVYDSAIVAWLELMKMPYTGCNARGLLLAGDKALSKKVLTYHRIKTPRFAVLLTFNVIHFFTSEKLNLHTVLLSRRLAMSAIH